MLSPTGHLPHKATSLRPGNTDDLPNTHKHRELGKMNRARNTFQMKEQHETSEKELHKMELSKLSHKEFNVIVIKSLTVIREEWMNTVRTSTKTQKN